MLQSTCMGSLKAAAGAGLHICAPGRLQGAVDCGCRPQRKARRVLRGIGLASERLLTPIMPHGMHAELPSPIQDASYTK